MPDGSSVVTLVTGKVAMLPLFLQRMQRLVCNSRACTRAVGSAQLLVHHRSLPRVELLLVPERTHAHDSGKKLPLARTQPRQFPHPRR